MVCSEMRSSAGEYFMSTPRKALSAMLLIALAVMTWFVAKAYLPSSGTPPRQSTGNQTPGLGVHGNVGDTYLLPVQTATAKARQDPEKFWDDVLPAMAADPRTAAVLQELFGGLRVQFVTQPAKSLEDLMAKSTPPAGFDVILRAGGPAKLHRGRDKDNKEVSCLKMDLCCVIVAPTSFFQDDKPMADEALFLAIEDRVLRQAAGWRFRPRRRPVDLDLGSMLQEDIDPEGLRPDLDRRIKDYAASYRAWLAAHPLVERRP
jgi:hypothetical protein